jgi:hypothetical protein
VQHVLQVQRRVDEHGEERGRDRERPRLRGREAAVAEELEREHRLLHAPLDVGEGHQQRRGAAELGDGGGAAPALLVAAQERQHQQEQAAAEHDLAEPVDRAGERIARLLHSRHGRGDGDHAERDVHREDPAPADAAREQSAHQRADGEGGADGGAVDGERPAALAHLWVGVREERQRDREHRGGAEALHRAGGVEHGDAARQRADERRHREQGEAGDEDTPAAEPVGERPERQHDGRQGERVRVDDPLEAAKARVQVVGDAGEGRVHDRDVQHEHRGGKADDGKRHTTADM